MPELPDVLLATLPETMLPIPVLEFCANTLTSPSASMLAESQAVSDGRGGMVFIPMTNLAAVDFDNFYIKKANRKTRYLMKNHKQYNQQTISTNKNEVPWEKASKNSSSLTASKNLRGRGSDT
ncbi:hypothetical protein E2C01_027513 [Portunus trituberculatus]|uniref:Uncharacterized protein n=1 Tax=Portunus trituberculatus TaxID=210409 RepID=A0A5B7EL19_PORTR|nr:hypothetical protein [Portunus trituberculatus]